MIKKLALVLGLTLLLSQISVAIDLYNTPLGELREIEDISIEELETIFSESLAGQYELAAAIKAYAPAEYDDLINAMIVSYGNEQTIVDVTKGMLPIIDLLWMDHLTYADEQSLLMYSQVMQPLLEAVENQPSDCRPLLMGDSQVMDKVALDTDVLLQDELHDMYMRVLQTSDDSRQMPSEHDVMPDLMTTMVPVIDEHGAEFLIALENPAQINHSIPCLAMSDLYKNISQLPEHDAAELLRFIIFNSPYSLFIPSEKADF